MPPPALAGKGKLRDTPNACFLLKYFGGDRDIILLCCTCSSLHCNENPIYEFLFWELRSFSPNLNIHVSVSDLYIPRIGPHIFCSRVGKLIVGIYKLLTDT
jgi:hypothetical protein